MKCHLPKSLIHGGTRLEGGRFDEWNAASDELHEDLKLERERFVARIEENLRRVKFYRDILQKINADTPEEKSFFQWVRNEIYDWRASVEPDVSQWFPKECSEAFHDCFDMISLHQDSSPYVDLYTLSVV